MFSDRYEEDYAAIFSLSLGWSGMIEFPPRHVAERHVHNYWELMYVERGHGMLSTSIGNVPFKSGDLIIYPPGVEHEEYIGDAGVKLHILAIAGKSGDRFLHFWPGDSIACLLISDSWLCSAFYSTILKINEELGKVKTAYLLRIYAYAFEFISYLYMYIEQTRPPSSFEPEHIIKTKAYMEDHYAEKLKLVDIAVHTYVSLYYLSHSFKEFTGDSPINYLLALRIKKAQELLVQSDYTITQISEMVGYENLQHFSSNFKQRSGITPREYRKRHRK